MTHTSGATRAFVRLVCLVCTLSLSAPASAGADLKKIQAALAGEENPQRRLAQVVRLADHGGAPAARLLAHLVEHDADVDVRAAAARALGRIKADNATTLLTARLVEGGPRQVREGIRQGLARRSDGRTQVLELLRDDRTAESDRLLLVAALQAFQDDASLQALFESLGSERSAVRGAALAAIAARSDHVARRVAQLGLRLSKARDEEQIMQLLDVCDAVLHATMRPAIQRHASSLEPAVRDAAEHLLRELDRRKVRAAARKPKVDPAPGDPDSRYAKPKSRDDDKDEPQEPPPATPRNRFDIVYAIDATGSAHPNLPGLRARIKQEMALLLQSGVSLRIGIIVYRGGRTARERRASLEILSPTFDARAVHAFLEEIQARGVDDRGAAVAPALHQALDRTPWRWAATRVVQILADSDVDDRRRAARTVRMHFQADRTRTRVAYVLRTRTRVPPAFGELARLGGTGVAELIK